MDISDDLCRADFFDLVPMGLDGKPYGDPASHHGLTPVALIDSSDYMQPDGNNNSLNGTSGHIKSFLDEMFLSESLNGSDPSHGLGSHFEVLGTWSADGTSSTTASTNEENSPSGDPSTWLLHSGFNNDGEVTTLTNLIDPLFVTYEDENGGSVTTKIENYLGENRAVSSDLISSTFLNEPSEGSPTQSTSESDLISWQKTDGLGNTIYCDDSLLRNALQSGNNNNNNSNTTKVVKLTAILPSPSSSSTSRGTTSELRKVLSFPPLSGSQMSSTTSDSQSQSCTSPSEVQPYYELKVIDPGFATHDDNIPNVEELIMTRIDPSYGGYQQGKDQKKKISETKINSTTLSTKWTYTTTNDQGKIHRKRTKKNPNNNNNNDNNNNNTTHHHFGLKKTHQISEFDSKSNGSNSCSGGSPSQQSNGSSSTTSGNGVRKERSLHYCNICSKGFKDKYSVNVHTRVHTGEKPFLCNLCSKAFRQKAHLAKHLQTHSAKQTQNKSNSKR